MGLVSALYGEAEAEVEVISDLSEGSGEGTSIDLGCSYTTWVEICGCKA